MCLPTDYTFQSNTIIGKKKKLHTLVTVKVGISFHATPMVKFQLNCQRHSNNNYNNNKRTMKTIITEVINFLVFSLTKYLNKRMFT